MILSPLSIVGREGSTEAFCQESCIISHDEQKRVFEKVLDGEFIAGKLVEIEQQWGFYSYRWNLTSSLAGKLTAGVQTLFSNQV